MQNSQRTALISVYNKEGIGDFAGGLIEHGFQIISSGGTAKRLRQCGISVTDVREISGLDPILRHRVVTLVPQIHGGLLATLDMMEELESLGFPWIDLVCVDLYPLQAEIAKPKATEKSVIDKTDIGGPTMLRSAAKGQRIVICDPADRARVLTWLKEGEPNAAEFKRELAAKAEMVCADYCLASARYHGQDQYVGLLGTRIDSHPVRYGENPSWNSTLYATNDNHPLSPCNFGRIEGADPSYVNLTDLNALTEYMIQISMTYRQNVGRVPNIAIGVKHGNACGAAASNDPYRTLRDMLDGNPRAIFGAMVMTNFAVGAKHAESLRQHGIQEGAPVRILDGVAAPAVARDAIAALRRKGGKCRVFVNAALAHIRPEYAVRTRIRPVIGGFLVQSGKPYVLDFGARGMGGYGKLDDRMKFDLCLAYAIGSRSTSNTITIVKEGQLIGNGVGQQDRVGAAQLASKLARQSGHNTHGAVAYSDSFFPFPDGIHVLAHAGIKAILTSRGSINDEKVFTACREHGITLAHLPDKECRGFYGH